MKMTPISQGQGVPAAEVGATSTQRTSPDRIAAAKAIAGGTVHVSKSDNQVDPQVERMQANIRKIKMRTQVSPDRDLDEIPQETTEVQPNSTISETNEALATEETKPLSPQFAALARQKRALQVKEREIAEREKALTSQPATDGGGYTKDRIKSDPLSVLNEAGVSYDQLTEAILNSNQYNPEIAALKEEIKALKEGVDTKFTDRDTQAEQQVLAEMRREADRLVAEGDTFEMIRATKSQPDVMELIHRTYKETGEVLDVTEALQLVEDELINESLKMVQIPKLQSRLAPAEANQAAQPNRQTRTLTNRDTARPVMGRRERMLAAFNETLKR